MLGEAVPVPPGGPCGPGLPSGPCDPLQPATITNTPTQPDARFMPRSFAVWFPRRPVISEVQGAGKSLPDARRSHETDAADAVLSGDVSLERRARVRGGAVAGAQA